MQSKTNKKKQAKIIQKITYFRAESRIFEYYDYLQGDLYAYMARFFLFLFLFFYVGYYPGGV